MSVNGLLFIKSKFFFDLRKITQNNRDKLESEEGITLPCCHQIWSAGISDVTLI